MIRSDESNMTISR